jgi:hypothetical protein
MFKRMKKLLKLFDDNILRFGVAFAILFTALYPKLPSVSITHTWVYIRLEDFLILALSVIWLIQLLRKKYPFPSLKDMRLFCIGLPDLFRSCIVLFLLPRI